MVSGKLLALILGVASFIAIGMSLKVMSMFIPVDKNSIKILSQLGE